MENFDEKESAKALPNSSDNVKLHLNEENSGIDNLYETNCGSCEGCKLAVDCGNCENCIINYIEMDVKCSKNPELFPCLMRMCNSMKMKFKIENGIVVPFANNVYLESIKTQATASDETGEKTKNCVKLEEELVSGFQQDKVLMKRKKTMTPEGIKMESDEEVCRKVMLMEYGSSSLENVIENCDNEDGSDDFSNSESTEMCGSCTGCTTNCGHCWTCIQREMVASKQTESRLICQNKKCYRKGTGSKVPSCRRHGPRSSLASWRGWLLCFAHMSHRSHPSNVPTQF